MKIKLGKLKSKGSNIYEDSYGKTLIGVPNKKTAYIVPPSDIKKLNLIQNRMVLPLLILIFVGFYLDWVIAILAAFVSTVIFELVYKSFLSKLEKVENVEFPAKMSRSDKLLKESRTSNIFRIAATIAFPILLIVNIFTTIKDWDLVMSFQDTNGVILVLVTALCSIYSIYMCSVTISAVSKQKQKKSKNKRRRMVNS